MLLSVACARVAHKVRDEGFGAVVVSPGLCFPGRNGWTKKAPWSRLFASSSTKIISSLPPSPFPPSQRLGSVCRFARRNGVSALRHVGLGAATDRRKDGRDGSHLARRHGLDGEKGGQVLPGEYRQIERAKN